MYAALIFLPLLFFVSYFNRFAGLRSGDGEYTSGVIFLRGIVPYRDYFLIAPPFNVLKSALLLKTFGTALIVSRSAGVAERLLIAVVLFRWLTKIFRSTYVLVACDTKRNASSSALFPGLSRLCCRFPGQILKPCFFLAWAF